MREVEHAEEEHEDARYCEPAPHGPEGDDKRDEARDGHKGRDRYRLRPVVLPLAIVLLDVLDPQDEVRGHQQPAAKAGEADVEPEAAHV